MTLNSFKYALLAALTALLFALPAQADENYWHQSMKGDTWQMSGAGGGSAWLLGIEAGYPDAIKVNFFKTGTSADAGAYFKYTYRMMDWGDNGIQLGANIRFKLMDQEKWDLALNIDPGLDLYFWNNYHNDMTIFGINVNLRLVAGIKIVERFRVHAGIVIPFEILFAGSNHFSDAAPWVSMPILLNGGAEFKILDWLSVMADIRFGPGIKFGDGVDWNEDPRNVDDEDDLDSGAWFQWETRLGVAFRF